MGIFDKVKSAIGEGGLALVQEAGTKFITDGLSGVTDDASKVPPPPLGQVPIESKFSAQVSTPSHSLRSGTGASEDPQTPPASSPVHDNAPATPRAGHVEQILQLNQMLQDGLISRSEFDVLKGGLFSSS